MVSPSKFVIAASAKEEKDLVRDESKFFFPLCVLAGVLCRTWVGSLCDDKSAQMPAPMPDCVFFSRLLVFASSSFHMSNCRP